MSPLKKISSLLHRSHNLKQAVGILFVTVLISNILGLLRNIIIANRVAVTYGSIGPLDNYYGAFVLPDLIYSIVIVGALSSAVLPLLVRIDTEGDDEKFFKTFNMLLSTGLTVMVLAVLGLYVLLPVLVPIVFSGFSSGELSQTIELSKILLLSPIFFTISQLVSSALQAKRRFFASALSPIIYNLAIIASALLIPDYGLSILVTGVIIGALAHFFIQLPSLLRLGWRFKFVLGFGSGEIRHVFKLMIPRAIALTGGQLLLICFYQIASNLENGSIAIYKLTDDLQTAPVLLFANTLAMAILPDFARHFVKAQQAEFERLVSKAIRLLIYLFLPITIYLVTFRDAIIGLYISLGHAIDPTETILATQTFKYFVISLFFQGAVLILARSYFARSDTARPTLYSIGSYTFAYFCALILTRYTDLGVAGLSLSFSIGSLMNFLLLWFNLKLPIRNLFVEENLKQNFLYVMLGGMVMAVAMMTASTIAPMINESLNLGRSWQNLVELLVGLVLGVAVYIAWSKVFNLEQWQLIKTRNSTET